jgi:glycogen debranching enzyme
MLMSKNWMCHVWSWDHCFNALALARHNPALAWDQLMLFADKQNAQGAFPDAINDAGVIWAFCKPPIHGWAVGEILKRTEAITRDQIAALYPALCRWTEWWLNYRDEDGDGIPQYNHGNDSGWDNATVFDAGLPVEAPDLSAYLVLQMDVLADLAVRLGRPADAALWRDRSAAMLKRLLEHSWNGEQFVSLRSNSHAANPSGDSLINYMPVVLGRRLPPEIQTRLVNGIRRFVTAHGLATENPQSPHYAADGYWRGPIWAPSTMLAVYGLAELGADDLVREISRKFCAMAARSGMAENYDALNGDGLRDRAYTWTASVFFLLASGYLY